MPKPVLELLAFWVLNPCFGFSLDYQLLIQKTNPPVHSSSLVIQYLKQSNITHESKDILRTSKAEFGNEIV